MTGHEQRHGGDDRDGVDGGGQGRDEKADEQIADAGGYTHAARECSAYPFMPAESLTRDVPAPAGAAPDSAAPAAARNSPKRRRV